MFRISRGFCSLLLVACFAILFTGSLSSCGGETSSDSIATLRYAEFKQALSTVTHLAQSQGYIEKLEVPYRSISLESGIEVMAALKSPASAGAHAGNLAYTPIANLIATGFKPVVIASTLSTWEHVKLVTFSEGTITDSAQSLHGKRIGRTSGIISETYLSRLLESEGMTEKDIIAVDGSPTELSAMLVRGDLDAAILWDPFIQQTERSYKRALESGSVEERGSIEAFVNPNLLKVVMAVVVPREKLENKRSELVSLLEALIEAEKYVNENREKARINVEQWLQLETGDLKAFFGTTKFEVVIDPEEAVASFETLLRERQKEQPSTEIPEDLYQFVDSSLLESIDSSRVKHSTEKNTKAA